jgi:hypothetical protein
MRAALIALRPGYQRGSSPTRPVARDATYRMPPVARRVRGPRRGMNPRPATIERVADALHYVLSTNR